MGIAAGRTLGLQLEPEAFHQRTHVQGQCLVSNALMLLCTVMAYASTSILILGSIIPGPNNIHGHAAEYSISANNPPKVVSGHALVTLTIGILGQCAVATVALRSAVSNPTWSSNPIDTAAACVDAGDISVVPGRCLRSVHDRVQGASPLAPSSRQGPAYRAHKEVRALWGTVALSLLWALVLIVVIRHFSLVDGMYYGHSWAFFPVIPESVDLVVSPRRDGNSDTSGTMTLAIPWNFGKEQNSEHSIVPFPSFCWTYALICLLQAVITLSLHCAELLVNVIRDEKMWRRAGSRFGGLKGEPGLSRKPTNALHALLVSGPAMTLFLYKPILHWIYSLAVTTYYSIGPVMHPPQIIYLTLGAVLLASFASVCAFWQPKGPQPATFGHLQTLVDLIDEWPEVGETIFWGRMAGDTVKSVGNKKAVQADTRALSEEVLEEDLMKTQSVAHAGTAASMLEEVSYDEVYMSRQVSQ